MMAWLRRGLVAPLAFLVLARPAVALQTDPIFQLQPGLLTADFYSAPVDESSTTAFIVRFLTRFSTGSAWFSPVIGASFTPWGSSRVGFRNTDAPALFAGNIFTLASAHRTSGWFTLELPLLVVHSPGAGSTGNVRDFGRDLVVQPTAYFHLGSRLFSDFGERWSQFDVFALLEQNLTPNRDVVTGKRDRLNPVAVFGASVSLGRVRPD